MPLDDRAKQFLGTGVVREVAGQTSKAAEERFADFKKKEFLTRAAAFQDDLVGFFVQQRRSHDYLDDECVAALALMTINLRHAFGEPQNDDEAKVWTPAKRAERLDVFDTICEAMQAYHDENS